CPRFISIASTSRLAVSSARSEPHRFLSSNGCLSWPNPQGREARRLACFAADQVRACHQPENSQGARAHYPAGRARHRRRSDRIAILFAALQVRFWHKADKSSLLLFVRFWG